MDGIDDFFSEWELLIDAMLLEDVPVSGLPDLLATSVNHRAAKSAAFFWVTVPLRWMNRYLPSRIEVIIIEEWWTRNKADRT
jgi:hypothetical protein